MSDKDPKGWNKYTSQDNFQVGVTEETCYSGTKCAYIKSLVDQPKGQGLLSQSLDATHYRGKRLRFSAFVKSTPLSHNASLGAMIYRDDHTTAYMEYCRIVEDSDWCSYEIVFDVPSSGVLLICSIDLEGEGTILIDDVHLEIVGTEVEITQRYLRPKRLNSFPTNLDFNAGKEVYCDENGKQWKIPIGWTMSSNVDSDVSIGLAKNTKGTIEGVISLQSIKSESPSCYFLQYVKASQFRGQQIRLSAQIKTKDLEICSLTMTSFGSDNQPIRFGFSDLIKPMKSTKDWKFFDCALPISIESDYFSFGLEVFGTGQVCLKDLQIKYEPFDHSEVDSTLSDPEVKLQNSEPTNLDLSMSATESESLSSSVPFGWKVDPGKKHKVAYDQNESLDGAPCVLIESIVDEPDEYESGNLTQHVSPENFLGKRLRFSSQVKTFEADWAAVWMRARHKGRYVYTIGSKQLHNSPIVGTTDWCTHDCVVDVPQDCVNLSFGVILYRRGKCWISSPKLEEVALDVPTNDIKVVPPKKKVIENADFEMNYS